MQLGKITSVIFNEQNYKDRVELELGDYELKQEGDKWFAIKKKPKYPTTYEECCKMLGYNQVMPKDHILGYKGSLLSSFQQLLICRDAYWKIAGWEPDYISDEYKYYINTYRGKIDEKDYTMHCNHILTFPTAEMRDAFYENFRDLIEQCKELL